jgi:photosystem II stability/assembly factor-like uncharacterized protein
MDEVCSMIVCLSPGGATLSADSAAASKILVATIDGVRILERRLPDGRWSVTRESLTGHHIGSLVYVPSADLVFAGAHSGGLFVSADGGQTWEPSMNGIPDTHRHIFTLAADPAGNVLYAGTEPPGLYRSSDLGRTWSDLPSIRSMKSSKWTFPAPPHTPHVKNVAIHPTQPETLYVSIEQGALLKSIDRGSTWEVLEPYGDWSGDAHRVAFRSQKPENPDELFMASGPGLFQTTDSGKTWHHLISRARGDRVGYPDAMVFDPHDDRVMYVAGAATPPDTWDRLEKKANPAILKSRDSGQTWEELQAGLPQPIPGNVEALSLHQCGSNIELYAASAVGDVFASYDRGESWRAIATNLPPISKVGHYKRFLDSSIAAAH